MANEPKVGDVESYDHRDDSVVQQLRFQLFRERAMTHALNAEHFETRRNHKRAARHRRAHSRFAILAELIRAGER